MIHVVEELLPCWGPHRIEIPSAGAHSKDEGFSESVKTALNCSPTSTTGGTSTLIWAETLSVVSANTAANMEIILFILPILVSVFYAGAYGLGFLHFLLGLFLLVTYSLEYLLGLGLAHFAGLRLGLTLGLVLGLVLSIALFLILIVPVVIIVVLILVGIVLTVLILVLILIVIFVRILVLVILLIVLVLTVILVILIILIVLILILVLVLILVLILVLVLILILVLILVLILILVILLFLLILQFLARIDIIHLCVHIARVHKQSLPVGIHSLGIILKLHMDITLVELHLESLVHLGSLVQILQRIHQLQLPGLLLCFGCSHRCLVAGVCHIVVCSIGQ